MMTCTRTTHGDCECAPECVPDSGPWVGHPHRAELLRAHAALHKLWTKYAYAPGYVKGDWKELDDAISEVARVAGRKR